MVWIPTEIRARILSEIDLVALVEEYVVLSKKSAQNYFGLCPFHSEDTPSFSVSPPKQIYKCFGCQKGGNAIDFLASIEGIPYNDAAAMLAKRLHITLPNEANPRVQAEEARKQRVLSCLLEAAKFYYRNMQDDSSKAAQAYMLQKRRLSIGILRKFGIGFSSASWDALAKHLGSLGFSHSEILAAGLGQKNKLGGIYDLFRARIIFPVFASFGQVIAFGGRNLDGSLPKYINSPETMVYKKGSQLYALNFARQNKGDHFILTEGYLDAMSMHAAGFTQTIAGLGTALTPLQAALIRKFRNKVIIAYDGDKAGKAAAVKAVELLHKAKLEVKVLCLPNELDPDDYLREQGADSLKILLEQALPRLDFLLLTAKEATKDQRGTSDLIKYQEQAVQLLSQENNAIVRELYAAKLAKELGISIATVQREIEHRLGIKTETSLQSPLPSTVKLDKLPAQQISLAELALITSFLDSKTDLRHIGQEITAADFSPFCRTFAGYFLAHVCHKSLSTAELLDLLEQDDITPSLKTAVLQCLNTVDSPNDNDSAQRALTALYAMRINRIEEEKADLLAEIDACALPDEQRQLLVKLQTLNEQYSTLKQIKEEKDYQ